MSEPKSQVSSTGMIFLNCLNDFNYFPLDFFLKNAGHRQKRPKMDLLKMGVDGFGYFSLIFIDFIF
jgi:hypothetical protein